MSKEFWEIPGNFFERIRKMTTYAYYRVSTDEQDYNNQKQGVLKLAENMNLVIEADEWTIYHYNKVQEFYNLLTRINAAIGESEER